MILPDHDFDAIRIKLQGVLFGALSEADAYDAAIDLLAHRIEVFPARSNEQECERPA